MDAREAIRLLGIKRETLYAYASRGLVRSVGALQGTRSRLYNRQDIERLRARGQARSGHGAVAASALRRGEPVLDTSIGSIGKEGPVYRGRTAISLVRDGLSFDDVCDLLWGVDHSAGVGDESHARGFGVPVRALRGLVKECREPFDGMSLTAALLATKERIPFSVAIARSRARTLHRRLVAGCGLPFGVDAVTASLASPSTTRALLVALGGRITAPRVAAMNEALILVADHDLSPSTFAARVVASAGASLAASVNAALSALSGPLHGGATARVEALLDEVGRPERAASKVTERLARGDSIPGFGEAFYPDGDPRGARLLDVAARIGANVRRVRVLMALVDAMALASRERPSVDLALVALSAALGLPRGSALAIFAAGRIAGFIAHALEQRAAGFVLRPRARYVADP